jgi:hypothetical protein
MTGYTVHTGSTVRFSEGWDNIFSGAPAKKAVAKKSAAKKGVPAKSSARKTATPKTGARKGAAKG